MTLEELQINIEELDSLPDRERLKKLRDYKRDLIKKVRALESERAEFRAQRNKENKESKLLFQEAREHQKQRDTVNDDVQLNKELRDLRQKDADKVLEELEKFEEGIREKFGDQGLGRNVERKHSRLARTIRELEMKVQTTARPSPEQEREMIDEIERLYKEMDKVEVVEEKRDELRAIKKRLRYLRGEALAHHREVQKLADLSQEHHEKMIQGITEAKKIRKAADANHKKVIELSEDIKKVRKEINKVSTEADRIRKKLGEETLSERKKRKAEEAKVKEEMENEEATEILKRYKEGEKLGFEEFKVLISKGLLKE